MAAGQIVLAWTVLFGPPREVYSDLKTFKFSEEENFLVIKTRKTKRHASLKHYWAQPRKSHTKPPSCTNP